MEADSEEYTNYIRDTATLRLSLWSGGYVAVIFFTGQGYIFTLLWSVFSA